MKTVVVHYLTEVTLARNEKENSIEIKAQGKLSTGKYRIKIEMTGGNNAPFTFCARRNQLEFLKTDGTGDFRFYGEWEMLEFLELMYVLHEARTELIQVEVAATEA